jgi:hypothetical protein
MVGILHEPALRSMLAGSAVVRERHVGRPGF